MKNFTQSVCSVERYFTDLSFPSEGSNFISVTPERTFDERRFVDAKTVMMVFIIASAAAMNMNHFFFADWKNVASSIFVLDLSKSWRVRAARGHIPTFIHY